jgi:hypothetical protein
MVDDKYLMKNEMVDDNEHFRRGVWHATIDLSPIPENALLNEGTSAFKEYLRGYYLVKRYDDAAPKQKRDNNETNV